MSAESIVRVRDVVELLDGLDADAPLTIHIERTSSDAEWVHPHLIHIGGDPVLVVADTACNYEDLLDDFGGI